MMSSAGLEVCSLEFTRGNRKILCDLSFEMERGQFLALAGPNGSGKSTLLKVLAGWIPLSSPKNSGKRFSEDLNSGVVRFLGQDLSRYSFRKRAQVITYLGTDLLLPFPLTAEQVVAMACSGERKQQGETLVASCMEKAMCWNLRDQQMANLSGGERQRVLLAMGLAQNSKILLLDETLSQMDLHFQVAVGQVLKELCRAGTQVILVSHDLNFALEFVDSVLLLEDGKSVFYGKSSDPAFLAALCAIYPGLSLQTVQNPQTGAPKIFFHLKE